MVDAARLVQRLAALRNEAEAARESGPNPRDAAWRMNWDLYWGRYDFSGKAPWQARYVMPEATQFVDRWAAAMREALIQSSNWFTVEDPADQNRDLAPQIEGFMRLLLGRAGRDPMRRAVPFDLVFEEQMKLGALMTCSAAVTWKDDWVAVESVDPREVWYDPTGRGKYRFRRYTIDRDTLIAMAEERDDFGDPLYDLDAILRLASETAEREEYDRQQATGYGAPTASARRTVVLEEFLVRFDPEAPDDENAPAANRYFLIVLANREHIIRGPEENPFWHEDDWIVSMPMITVPFSIYGRSYVEDWSSVALAFSELTNLILDATSVSAINAYVAQPNLLRDSTELLDGVRPGKIFQLDNDVVDGRGFLQSVELGRMPPEVLALWSRLKAEMQEGAKLNEIALGQLPPGEKTATEISQAQQSGSAIVRSIAHSIEVGLLEPLLTKIWQTALQHMDFMSLAPEIGGDVAEMLEAQREAFRTRQIRFRVRGLSGLIDRQTKLRNMLQMLQVVGSNELLLQAFLQRFDAGRILEFLVTQFGVDAGQFVATDRERALAALAGRAPATASASAPSTPPGPEAPDEARAAL